MIELPEALTLGAQMQNALTGKTILRALPPTRAHKFCWFNGDPAAYDERLKNARVAGATGFGSFAQIAFDNGQRLCINDGVNARLLNAENLPRDYQAALLFTDGGALCFTVAMYGGIYLHAGDYDNKYYLKSLAYVSPFSPAFAPAFNARFDEDASLSAKAFLATRQRFPGIGNGALQDILFGAGIHPKRKLKTFSADDRARLLKSAVSTLRAMADAGGRDTEKDLFGAPGGYQTRMSRAALSAPCPVCGGEIVKEAYMGGAVYYCPHCQPLVK